MIVFALRFRSKCPRLLPPFPQQQTFVFSMRSDNVFRIRSYAKRTSNSFRIRSYENHPGVWGGSHFAFCDVQTFRPSDLPTLLFSAPCRLFVTKKEALSFIFNSLQPLSRKHPGWQGAPLPEFRVSSFDFRGSTRGTRRRLCVRRRRRGRLRARRGLRRTARR